MYSREANINVKCKPPACSAKEKKQEHQSKDGENSRTHHLWHQLDVETYHLLCRQLGMKSPTDHYESYSPLAFHSALILCMSVFAGQYFDMSRKIVSGFRPAPRMTPSKKTVLV